MAIDRNNLIEFAIKINGGSGCLIKSDSNDYDYIYTAKHLFFKIDGNGIKQKVNFKDLKYERYRLVNGKESESEELKPKDIYLHPDSNIDAAIVIIEKMLDFNPPYEFVTPNFKENEVKNCHLIGFPKISQNNKNKNHFNIEDVSKISKFVSFNLIEANLDYNVADYEDVVGFSGGGVIIMKDESFEILGIQSEMPTGPGKIHLMPISYFLEIIELIEIAEFEPDALLISIKDDKKIFFREPKNSKIEDIKDGYIDSKQFSNKVTTILQRLVFEEKLGNEEYEILGISLLKSLLPTEPLQEKFKSLINSHKLAVPLKIILRFDENSGGLACLPWEYLCFENNGINEFVGSKKELILVRRLSGINNEPITLNKKLNVLIAVSKFFEENLPNTPIKLDADLIKAGIENIVDCNVECFNSLETFGGYLKGKQIDCIHIFGQYIFEQYKNEVAKYQIAFVDKDSRNNPKWYTHLDFIKLFGGNPPKIIFLHGEKIEKNDEPTNFNLSGFAFELTKEINNVITIPASQEGSYPISYLNIIYKGLIEEKNDLDKAITISLGMEGAKINKGYGISAAFSRQAFRVEIGADTPQIRKIDWCPNKLKDSKRPGQTYFCQNDIKLNNGKPILRVCGNDLCKLEFEYLCSNCQMLIIKNADYCNKCSQSTTPIKINYEEHQSKADPNGKNRAGLTLENPEIMEAVPRL